MTATNSADLEMEILNAICDTEVNQFTHFLIFSALKHIGNGLVKKRIQFQVGGHTHHLFGEVDWTREFSKLLLVQT